MDQQERDFRLHRHLIRSGKMSEADARQSMHRNERADKDKERVDAKREFEKQTQKEYNKERMEYLQRKHNHDIKKYY